MASTPVTNGHKSKKHSKVVTLRIPPSLLEQFMPKKEMSSSSASSPKTGIEDEMPTLKPAVSQDNPSESNSTPVPVQDAPTPGATGKKKGPGAGTKRGPALTADGLPKPRGKPGPKKKPRLEDGTIDHSARPANPGGTANPKLGPKANTGNINANLRALDRSGKPCRKWQRKGFQLKSFTGVVWELSSWKGGEQPMLLNGTNGLVNDVSMQDSSDMKPSESDTAQGSNAGENQDRMEISTMAASSPAPVQSMPVITAQS